MLEQLKLELREINWGTKTKLIKDARTVCIFSILLGLFIFGVTKGLNVGLNLF